MNENDEVSKRLNKLRKYLPVFIACPYARAIFLGGSVSLGSAAAESDIDIFVVSKNNRVWLSKLFMASILSIVGERRTRQNFSEKFCLNVFLSNKNPILPHQDNIGASFYKNLIPVWSENENEIKNFWEVNSWIKNFCDISQSARRNIFAIDEPFSPFADFSRKFFEKIFDFSGLGFAAEKISFALQKLYLKKRLEKSGAKNSEEYDFFVSPNLIAYHFPVSNYRKEFERFKSKLARADVEKLDNL